LHCPELKLTDLKVIKGSFDSMSVVTTASGTFQDYPADGFQVEDPVYLDVYCENVCKIGTIVINGNRSLPESFSETFEGTIAPVDHQNRAFLNFIESHYTSIDLLPITLGKPRVLDPSVTPPDISFGQIILRGRVHDMIKKITVHLGTNLLSTTVYVDFLFENPLACDFTIVSLDVKARTIGQSNRLLATASHSFSQPFMIKPSECDQSPIKEITSCLEMSISDCMMYLGKDDPQVNIEVSSATIIIDGFRIENVNLTFGKVPLDVKAPIPIIGDHLNKVAKVVRWLNPFASDDDDD